MATKLPRWRGLLGPVLDSVNGQINFSFPAVYQGREVQDVQLNFRDGKVVDARAARVSIS